MKRTFSKLIIQGDAEKKWQNLVLDKDFMTLSNLKSFFSIVLKFIVNSRASLHLFGWRKSSSDVKL